METDTAVAQAVAEPVEPGFLDRRRRREMAEQVEGTGAVPEVVEAGGEAGQRGVEVFANLAVEGGGFFHQVAAMANEEL